MRPRLTSGMPNRVPLDGDEQVAGQGDLEAARDREALHGRDERLARGALRDAREAAIVDVRALALDERTEIHARGEALAGAGEDADLEVVVGVQRVQRVRDALRDRLVHGVARVGPVERDDEDPVAPLGEDSLIAHAGSLRAPVGFRPLAATHWT